MIRLFGWWPLPRQGASGLAIAVGASVAMSCNGAAAQSLDKALALAYSTNPQLDAARAGLRAGDELAAQARAGGRPRVGASLSYSYAEGSFDAGISPEAFPPGFDSLGPLLEEFGGGGFGTTNAGLQIEQPLFQSFRVRNAIREADARIDAATYDLAQAEAGVLAQAVQAYLGVTRAMNAVDVARQRLVLLQQQRDAVGVRFDTGQATRTDIAQTDAQLAGAEAALIAAEADLNAARLAFNRVIGQMPVNIEDAPALPALPATLDEAIATGLERNPALQAARELERASAHALKVARGRFGPTVSATASLSESRNSFIDGDESSNATIGAQVTVPLYQGGAIWSGVRQAREQHEADRHRVRDAERQLREQVAVAWQQVGAARAALAASEEEVAAAELAFEGIQLERDYGQRSVLDVLNTEQALAEARLNGIAARERYVLSAYNLRFAIGTLSAGDLGLDVALYDPTQNRDDVAGRWFGE